MAGGDEDPGWGRSTWARWLLDHDDAQAAALELEAGDDVDVPPEEFPALARALHGHGLAAIYEDGHVHVHTPAEADQILAEMARDALAAGDRMPPARSPAPLVRQPRSMSSPPPRRPHAIAPPPARAGGQSRRR
jgi:hypothetical protein